MLAVDEGISLAHKTNNIKQDCCVCSCRSVMKRNSMQPETHRTTPNENMKETFLQIFWGFKGTNEK
jgi:hypothetical protein